MALYHFNVTQVSRGKGQSAIASAAYRSGEKLMDDYYGEVQDYTRKGGILYTEIILPEHAPGRLSDRQTLWNEVENIEKHPQAQLSYSFNIALQNEFSYEENLALAKQFVQENFVSRGMLVDFAVHDPDKGEDGIQNPHFHVISPIRPLNPDGTWGNKQRREYLLDENGNRIKDEKGKFKFNAVPTTDWGSPETLLLWRENWAKLVNAKFEEKGLPERIDHRSYVDMGLDLLPTIHEGPAVRAMEKRGIATDVGTWNRMIRSVNSLIKRLRSQIINLGSWIAELSKELSEENASRKEYTSDHNAFITALNSYYTKRNEGAYSQKAKINNIKKQAEIIQFLKENNLGTLSDLQSYVSEMYSKVSELQTEMKALEKEKKGIQDTQKALQDYKDYKPIYDKLCTIKRKSASDAYKESHHMELTLFYRARRVLSEKYPNMSVPAADLQSRLNEINSSHSELFARYKELKKDTDKTYSLKKAIEADYQKAIEKNEINKSKKRKEEEL